MSEAKFQKKIIDALECRGWIVVKNIKVNKNGWPDLTAYKAGYPALFIEVKDTKGVLSPIQKFRIKQLRKSNLKVRVLWK